MHTSIWEKVADTLFWMQLCWILSGFVLTAYLAFKICPKSKAKGRNGNEPRAVSKEPSGTGNRELMIAGNYRLESFPHVTLSSAKIIEFQSIISEPNRRLL